MNINQLYQVILLSLISLLLSFCALRAKKDFPADVPWSDYMTEIDRYQQMVDSTIAYIENNASRFGVDSLDQFKMIDQTSKADLVAASSSIMDYLSHLDFIRFSNQGHYYQFPGEINFESFVNYYTAFLIQSSRAVHFITIIERNEALPVVLDEAYPEYGLDANSYTQFKDHFLDPTEALEFTRLQMIYREHRPEINPYYRKIAMLEGYNLSQGLDYGVGLSFDHASSVVEREGFSWWFPIQKDVAEWMGTIRFFEDEKRLISDQDIRDIHEVLAPGDIFFQRREWNLTNAGIPGYWTHAALFVGDSLDRVILSSDDSVKQWVRSMDLASGSFEELLSIHYPAAYRANVRLDSSNASHSVIESLSPGVVFQTLDVSLDCDGVGVLRPRLSNLEKAQAIYRSFKYFGRNYDYNFDFLTDSTLVCSELVYKTFEPSETFTGVNFVAENVAGRFTAPANKMVQQFDREHGVINLDFVCFYDGDLQDGRAYPKDETSFRESWRRLGLYPLVPSEFSMVSPEE